MPLHSGDLSGALDYHRIKQEKLRRCQHFLGIEVARWDLSDCPDSGKKEGCWVSDASIYGPAGSRRIDSHHFHSFFRKLF